MDNIDKQVGELADAELTRIYKEANSGSDALSTENVFRAMRAALQSAQAPAGDGCGCCGDGCKDRGSCRHGDENPPAQVPAGEAVAKWSRNTQTQEIEFEVIGDPYVINGTKLYTAPPDQSARIAELERENAELRQSWDTAIKVAREGADALDHVAAERDEARRQLAEAQAWIKQVMEMQKRHYGDGIKTHLALADLCNAEVTGAALAKSKEGES